MADEQRPDWRRMGAAAKRRRAELGLLQSDLRDRIRPPIGIETIRRVEAGDQPGYRLTTLAAVARALEWPADALERIANGEPVPQTVNDERLDLVEERLSQVEATVDALLARLEGEEPS